MQPKHGAPLYIYQHAHNHQSFWGDLTFSSSPAAAASQPTEFIARPHKKGHRVFSLSPKTVLPIYAGIVSAAATASPRGIPGAKNQFRATWLSALLSSSRIWAVIILSAEQFAFNFPGACTHQHQHTHTEAADVVVVGVVCIFRHVLKAWK